MSYRLDTCGCELAISETGEPDAFEGAPCDLHADASVADVVAENRAKNAAVTLTARTGVPSEAIVWGFDEDRTAFAGTLDLMSAAVDQVAQFAPLTLQEFAAAVEG